MRKSLVKRKLFSVLCLFSLFVHTGSFGVLPFKSSPSASEGSCAAFLGELAEQDRYVESLPEFWAKLHKGQPTIQALDNRAESLRNARYHWDTGLAAEEYAKAGAYSEAAFFKKRFAFQYGNREDLEDAAELYVKADDYSEAAHLYAMLGDKQSAAHFFKKAGNKQAARQFELLNRKSIKSFDLLKRAQSKEDFEKAAKELLNSENYAMAAEAFESAGLYSEAAEATLLNPGYVVSRYNIAAKLFDRAGKSSEATTCRLLLPYEEYYKSTNEANVEGYG